MTDFGFETTAEEAAKTFASEITGKTGEPRIHPQLLGLSTFSASDVFVNLMTRVSSGSLGVKATLQIARQQPNLLILTGRNLAKIQETKTTINSTVPDASIRLLELDLASQNQIKKAAEEVNSYCEPIDVLINSAGIMTPRYSLTEDGLESQFGANHIGHFLFTNLIMGKILQVGKRARIVNISSYGHRRSSIRWDDYNFGNGDTYDKWEGYGQGKTVNILFSVELAEKLGKKGVLAYSLHPGVINTPLSKHMTLEDRKVTGIPLISIRNRAAMLTIVLQDSSMRMANPKKTTVPQGASTYIVAAFDPSIADQNGGYLKDCQVHIENCFPHANDKDAAARLWTLSEAIVG